MAYISTTVVLDEDSDIKPKIYTYPDEPPIGSVTIGGNRLQIQTSDPGALYALGSHVIETAVRLEEALKAQALGTS